MGEIISYVAANNDSNDSINNNNSADQAAKPSKLHWKKDPSVLKAAKDHFKQLSKDQIVECFNKQIENNYSDSRMGHEFSGCSDFVVRRLQKQHGVSPSKFAKSRCGSSVCQLSKLRDKHERMIAKLEAQKLKEIEKFAEKERELKLKSIKPKEDLVAQKQQLLAQLAEVQEALMIQDELEVNNE